MNLLDFGLGLAQHLSDNGVGKYVRGREFRSNETGIYIGEAPQGVSCIALRCYRVSEDVDGQAVWGVQFTLRTEPKTKGVGPLLALEDSIRDLLHGANHFDLPGGIEVTQFTHFNSTEPVRADDERWGLTTTYYAEVTAPGQHLY